MRNSLMIFCILIGTCKSVLAYDMSLKPSEAEFRQLPVFCRAKLNNDPALISIYAPKIGRQFQSIHHYCDGLVMLNRSYLARDRKERGQYLSAALNNFSYMNEHLVLGQGNASLNAEMLMNQAVAEAGLGRDTEAGRNFLRAIEFDPRLDKAYDQYAKILSARDQTADALAIVTQGLRYVPGSKRLKRRFEELGGKLPYPEPVGPVELAPTPDPKEASTDTLTNEVVAEPAKPEESPPAPANESSQSAGPEIGSPTNPWCRFCPK